MLEKWEISFYLECQIKVWLKHVDYQANQY